MAERKCVLALGFFDGVHRGHAALLNRTIERAEALGVEGAVMTFDTHPDTLVQGTPVPLINSAPDRANLIRRLFGIDRVEFFRFTEETMHMPWEEFLRSIQSELGVVGFVVGYDFRFGWRGEGNTGRLRDYCAANGLTCDVVDKVELDGITVSSTYIRSLLREGDMLRAEYFMGHPHFLTDVVRHSAIISARRRSTCSSLPACSFRRTAFMPRAPFCRRASFPPLRTSAFAPP